MGCKYEWDRAYIALQKGFNRNIMGCKFYNKYFFKHFNYDLIGT